MVMAVKRAHADDQTGHSRGTSMSNIRPVLEYEVVKYTWKSHEK